jgi:hypothetical protein
VSDDKILCRTPTAGKQPTRIDTWKYDAVRRGILAALDRLPVGVEFGDLPRMVERELSDDERERLGSIMWYTTTVKLDLEVQGEIERVPGAKPQRIRRPA